MATAFNRARYLYMLDGGDTASFDVTVAGAAPGGLITDYADLLSYATALMDAYTIGGGGDPYLYLKEALSTSHTFTGVNAQYVQGTEVIVSAYAQLGTPEPGTGAVILPNQVAWVASLRTDEAGRTARGRCYFPATGVTLGADGLANTPSASAFANSFGSLLADVSSLHTDPTAEIQVYSRTLDVLRPVTRVLVDATLDTQRRRRNKLVSPYVTSGTYPV